MGSGGDGLRFWSHLARGRRRRNGFGHGDRRGRGDAFADAAFDPFSHGAFGARDEDRSEEGAEFFDGNSFEELAFVRVGKATGFFRDDNDDSVGFFSEADGGAMAGAQGFAEVLALGERENAGGESNAVAFEDDTAVVKGVIREENGFEH